MRNVTGRNTAKIILKNRMAKEEKWTGTRSKSGGFKPIYVRVGQITSRKISFKNKRVLEEVIEGRKIVGNEVN